MQVILHVKVTLVLLRKMPRALDALDAENTLNARNTNVKDITPDIKEKVDMQKVQEELSFMRDVPDLVVSQEEAIKTQTNTLSIIDYL